MFLIEKGGIFQRTKQIFIQDIINFALEKEYKATLINSAVTGKIKVPQAGETKAVA
ncbi:hypothetical protein [Desulfobacula sp.]